MSEAVGDGGTKRCESIKKTAECWCSKVWCGVLKWLAFRVTTKLIVVELQDWRRAVY